MFASHIKFPFVVLFFSLAAGIAPVCAGEGEDASTLRVFCNENDLIPSVVRNSVSVSRTAENITIVTADEIEALNAHTLAIPVQNIERVDVLKGPASASRTLRSCCGIFGKTCSDSSSA